MEDQDYREFLVDIKKARTKKDFKIKHSFRLLNNYRKFIAAKKRNKLKMIISYADYSKIINKFNGYLVDELFKGKVIRFPADMGSIRILRYKLEPKLDENDNLVYKAPINWDRTLKYWYECPEAKERKILIRVEPGYTYKINYVKGGFTNKEYFLFSPMRTLKSKLKAKVVENKLETLQF